MCNCIDEVNDKLKEAGTNTAIDVPFVLSGNNVSASRPVVATRKIDSKQRGKAQKVFCSYCPFCGEKY